MRALLITFGLVFASVVGRADPIENPEFKQWASFKSGTSIVMSMTSEFNGMKSATKIGTKLLEVGADKLVLEVETATVVNGMEFKGPPTKREVTKTIDVPKVEGAPGHAEARSEARRNHRRRHRDGKGRRCRSQNEVDEVQVEDGCG